MTRTLRLKDLESAAANDSEQPFFTTGASGRSGSRAGYVDGEAPYTPVGVIFEEHFDDQPDYTSTMHSTEQSQFVWSGGTLPDNWDALYQTGFYAPPEAHDSLEILAANSDKSRSGTGKSAVHWREHHINPDFITQWKSNSALGVHLPGEDGGGYEELYIEFWIAFDPNWTMSKATSKIFRVFSWDQVEADFWQAFSGGSQGPLFLWDYGLDESYGIRNRLSFRGGPHGENYGMTDNHVGDLNRSLGAAGDYSGNFSNDLVGATYGDDPVLQDKTTEGQNLPTSGTLSHEQVYGPGGTWSKIGIYVKMNSAPGVQDGVLKQWLDDQLILETNKVTWVNTNTESKMVKWNAFSIGGNDYWVNGGYTNEEQREEWYAIDDIVVRDSLPEDKV